MRLTFDELVELELALQEAEQNIVALGEAQPTPRPKLTREQIEAQIRMRFQSQRDFSMASVVTASRRRWRGR